MRVTARRHLLLSLCFVLLFIRIAGVHQHLCFDGREPPVSVHVLDTGCEHQADQGNSSHDDQNVDDASKTLIKSAYASVAADFVALIFVLLTVLPIIRRQWIARSDDRPATSAPHFIRPPLRGPPLAFPC